MMRSRFDTSARSHRFGRWSSLVLLLPSVLLVAASGAQRSPGSAAPAAAPCVDAKNVTWTPGVPRAGSLFDIRVHAGAGAIRHASLAGVPLVQRAGSGDTTRMLGAIPIDSVHGVTLDIECMANDTVRIRIASDSGNYRLERLRVAPQFSASPDSALAARLADESARPAAVARASLATPVLWRSAFIAPRPTRITSTFGSGRMFNGEVLSRHMGTDFAGAVGAAVNASNRGVVRLTGRFYLGGNVVYVDHGAGLTTAYLHLSRTLVAEGDTVERGQTIGRVGATGRVTGPHLHFIARLGGITVDPMSLIGRR